jgi:hypothetical protein
MGSIILTTATITHDELKADRFDQRVPDEPVARVSELVVSYEPEK